LLVIIGWVLTVPGVLAIAGVVADLTGLLDAAGCAMNFNSGAMGCAPGLFGGAMSVLQAFAMATYMVVGLVPIVWSIAYPIVRWRRRAQA